jgi:hypothetical protein
MMTTFLATQKSLTINIFSLLLPLLAFSLIFNSGCAEVYNSSSTDKLIYGSSVAGGSKFQIARIGLLNKCSRCHSFYGTWTESQFFTDSKYGVSRANPSQSPIYCHSRGNDTCGPGDMPLSGSDLTDEELSKIKDWITSS